MLVGGVLEEFGGFWRFCGGVLLLELLQAEP